MRKNKQLCTIELIVSKAIRYILFDFVVLEDVDLAVVSHSDYYFRR